ncbi:hypothetical protein ACFVRU_51510 [Streptomyces sp. NPDC057927]
MPVYPRIAAGLLAAQPRGTWYALCVDRALDAFGHVRAVVAGHGHKRDGECGVCPAETLAVGDINAVMAAAQGAGADTTSASVPDVYTPFAE